MWILIRLLSLITDGIAKVWTLIRLLSLITDGIANSVDPDQTAQFADGIASSVDPDQFVCVEVLRPSQPNGVMSSEVSLPNHTFTGQA